MRMDENGNQADSCALCRFWDDADPDKVTRDCLRFPPGPGAWVPFGDGQMAWANSTRARTSEYDWCGEFRATGSPQDEVNERATK